MEFIKPVVANLVEPSKSKADLVTPVSNEIALKFIADTIINDRKDAYPELFRVSVMRPTNIDKLLEIRRLK